MSIKNVGIFQCFFKLCISSFYIASYSLVYSLDSPTLFLADADDDDQADLTFVEAAFTSIPYLSWSEIVIGDPLMRVAYGPGGLACTSIPGDYNFDGEINLYDLWQIKIHLGGSLTSPIQSDFEKYHDLCDVNQDGIVNYADLWEARNKVGESNE